MTKQVLILIFSIILPTSAFSQHITGKIVEAKTKQVVEAASVAILKSDSSYVGGGHTDSLGIFKISGQFTKQDYIAKVTFLGYKTSFTPFKYSTNINLGTIELTDESHMLGEVTVSASRIVNAVDRQIITPDSLEVKASTDAFDLIRNMSLSNLIINPVDQTITKGREDVQLRINGIRATAQEVAAVRPEDVVRVEFYEDPGVRFGNEDVGAVLNIIVTRSKEYGGYISLDLRHTPDVSKYGNDNITIKTNYKNSEFGLNYSNYYRTQKESWREITETLNFSNNPIQRDRMGIKDLWEWNNHRINLSYNLTATDKYVFNVLFKNQINSYDSWNSYNNIYSNIGKTVSRENRYGNDYTPILDLYYKQELKNKQSLTFNVVGTMKTSKSNSMYNEVDANSNILPEIFNRTEGDTYSYIAEGIYEKKLDKIVFSSGVKQMQSYAENIYKGNTDATSHMRSMNTYMYAQIQGKLGEKFGYNVGVGGTRIGLKDDKRERDFYFLRPSIQFSYSISKKLTAKYNFTLNTRTPSLGMLSDIRQESDGYLFSIGNPDLKPYNMYQNRFSLNYSIGIFDISPQFWYVIANKPYMTSYIIENGKIGSLFENQERMHYFSTFLDIKMKLIKDIWTVTLWGGGNRSVFHSAQGFIRTTPNSFYFMGGGNTNVQYKNFSFTFGAGSRYRELWGETIWMGNKWSYTELGYKYKDAKFMVGMQHPLVKANSWGNEGISEIRPMKEMTYSGGDGQMLYLRFSWNMSFGRKHKAGEKTLNNTEMESSQEGR